MWLFYLNAERTVEGCSACRDQRSSDPATLRIGIATNQVLRAIGEGRKQTYAGIRDNPQNHPSLEWLLGEEPKVPQGR